MHFFMTCQTSTGRKAITTYFTCIGLFFSVDSYMLFKYCCSHVSLVTHRAFILSQKSCIHHQKYHPTGNAFFLKSVASVKTNRELYGLTVGANDSIGELRCTLSNDTGIPLGKCLIE